MIILLFFVLWSQDFVLDENTQSNQYLPYNFQNAVTENSLHIIVSGYENPDWLRSRNFVYFKPFNGIWSPKKEPYTGDDFDEYPVILSDENEYLYLFYQKITKYTDYGVYYQRSSFPREYENFTFPQGINFGSDVTSEMYVSTIMGEGNRINLVFSSDSGGYFNIYHGIEVNPYYFETNQLSSYGDNIFPQIFYLKDTTYIFYLKILSDGSSYITLNKFRQTYSGEIVFNNLGNNIKEFFALPYFNNYILLFYTQDKKLSGAIYDVNSSQIVDTQSIFSGVEIEEPNAVNDSFGIIHLFFTLGAGEEKDIFYTYSSSGLDFPAPEQLTFTPFASYSPHSFYSKNEGNLYVFWVDERDRPVNPQFYSKIYYRFKSIGKKGGVIFSKNILKSEDIKRKYAEKNFFDILGRKVKTAQFKGGVIFLKNGNKKVKFIGL